MSLESVSDTSSEALSNAITLSGDLRELRGIRTDVGLICEAMVRGQGTRGRGSMHMYKYALGGGGGEACLGWWVRAWEYMNACVCLC